MFSLSDVYDRARIAVRARLGFAHARNDAGHVFGPAAAAGGGGAAVAVTQATRTVADSSFKSRSTSSPQQPTELIIKATELMHETLRFGEWEGIKWKLLDGKKSQLLHEKIASLAQALRLGKKEKEASELEAEQRAIRDICDIFARNSLAADRYYVRNAICRLDTIYGICLSVIQDDLSQEVKSLLASLPPDPNAYSLRVYKRLPLSYSGPILDLPYPRDHLNPEWLSSLRKNYTNPDHLFSLREVFLANDPGYFYGLLANNTLSDFDKEILIPSIRNFSKFSRFHQVVLIDKALSAGSDASEAGVFFKEPNFTGYLGGDVVRLSKIKEEEASKVEKDLQVFSIQIERYFGLAIDFGADIRVHSKGQQSIDGQDESKFGKQVVKTDDDDLASYGVDTLQFKLLQRLRLGIYNQAKRNVFRRRAELSTNVNNAAAAASADLPESHATWRSKAMTSVDSTASAGGSNLRKQEDAILVREKTINPLMQAIDESVGGQFPDEILSMIGGIDGFLAGLADEIAQEVQRLRVEWQAKEDAKEKEKADAKSAAAAASARAATVAVAPAAEAAAGAEAR